MSSRQHPQSIDDVLPSSLMLYVFSRLPVKSIMFCKCVCKNWHDLVTEPYFVHLHLSRSHEALIIHEIAYQDVFKSRPGSLEWVEWADYLPCRHKSLNLNRCASLDGTPIIRVGSVDGLVSYQRPDDFVYVFNPVLEEYITLPKMQFELRPQFYGFGVSAAGEYKMIRICSRRVSVDPLEHEVKVNVYTLGTLHWRVLGRTAYHQIGKVELDEYPHAPWDGVYLNSHVYFLLGKEIYDVDLNMETFELFRSPPGAGPREGNEEESKHMLGVLKGRLSRVSWCLSRLEVWVMKEESWYKEIAIKDAVVRFKLGPLGVRPLCLVDGLKGTSIFMLVDHSTSRLMAYCLNTNTVLYLELRGCFNSLSTYRPSCIKLDNFGLWKGVHKVYANRVRAQLDTRIVVHFFSQSQVSWCSSRLEVWTLNEECWCKDIAIQDEVVGRILGRPLCLVDGSSGASIFMAYAPIYVRPVAYCLKTNTIKCVEMRSCLGRWMTYRPSFVKLDNFGSGRVHKVYDKKG